MAQTVSGIKKDLAEIDKELANPKLNPDVRKVIQAARDKAQGALSELEGKPTGKSPAAPKAKTQAHKAVRSAIDDCKEILAKHKASQAKNEKRIAKRKAQGKPAELTVPEAVGKAAKAVKKKVEKKEDQGKGVTKNESKEVIDKILSIVDELLGGMPSYKDKLAFLTMLGMFIDARFAKVKEVEDKGERGMHVPGGKERAGQMRIFHYTTEHFDISPKARNYFQRIMDNQAMAERHKSIVIAMAKDVDRMLASVKQAEVSHSADKKDFTTATGHLMRAMYYSYVVVQTIEGPLGNINAWYPGFLAEDLYQVADRLHSSGKMAAGGQFGKTQEGLIDPQWEGLLKRLYHAVEQKAYYDEAFIRPNGREMTAIVRYVNDDAGERYVVEFVYKHDGNIRPFFKAVALTSRQAKEDIYTFVYLTTFVRPIAETGVHVEQNEQDADEEEHKYGFSYWEERGMLSMWVTDLKTDETVWHERYEGNPEESTIFEDGFMKNLRDLDGLRKYLIQMDVLPSDAELVNVAAKGVLLYDRGGKTVPGMVYENGDRTIQKLTVQQLGQVNTSLSNDEESSDKELADFWATETGISKKDGMHIIKKYRAKFRTNPLFELTQPGSPRPYEFAEGGAVKFADKVKDIAKSLKGEPVPKKYQKKGEPKKYTPAMAREAARRIAGAMEKD